MDFNPDYLDKVIIVDAVARLHRGEGGFGVEGGNFIATPPFSPRHLPPPPLPPPPHGRPRREAPSVVGGGEGGQKVYFLGGREKIPKFFLKCFLFYVDVESNSTCARYFVLCLSIFFVDF